MIHRFDKLATELPEPAAPNANAAAAVQELMGGKFGEMSTIMNYTFQSFNFRNRTKYRPFYDLVAKDYRELDKIWNGSHPEDGQELVVEDDIPEGAPWPEFEEEPQLVSPGTIEPEMIEWYAEALKA